MTDNYENHESEQHEHDEFVEPEIGLSSQSAKKNVASNLAEAWRTRPLVKFIVLIVAVSAVGFAGMNFLGGNDHEQMSKVMTPPNVHSAPGGASTPYHDEQTKMANDERAQIAVATGGSSIPTPILEKSSTQGFGGDDPKKDPLNELRVETERLQKQVQQQQVQQQQAQQKQEPFDNSLAEAMQQQMKRLQQGWEPKGIKVVQANLNADEKSEQKDSAANAAANQTGTSAVHSKPVVDAGTVSYAQLLTEANSDVPGPILAQIVSGPLSGSRAIGAFQVSDGYEKYLVLKFTLADRKGKDYKISAYALDPDTTLGGMATEVDERYFARVVLPAAAGFLQGLGQALGQGNSATQTNGTISLTTTTSDGFRQGMYNGLGQAAQTAGQFFQNQANLTKPLVRVASGTPMGLFFTAPVYDPDAPINQVQQVPANGNGNNGYGNNGYGGPPYPGTTVNGFGGQNGNSGLPYPNYSNPGGGYGNLRGPTMNFGSNPGMSSFPGSTSFGQ